MITNCKDCFCLEKSIHEWTEQIMFICGITKDGVGNYDYIPEWCPLRKEVQDETNMEQS